jgi:hypothetical protein
VSRATPTIVARHGAAGDLSTMTERPTASLDPKNSPAASSLRMITGAPPGPSASVKPRPRTISMPSVLNSDGVAATPV